MGGLLGCVEAVVESVARQRGLADVIEFGRAAIGIMQSYASGNILFFGISYGIIALVVTMMFDYEPDPRRFKRVMALALLPLALFLSGLGFQGALRHPALFDASDSIVWVAHVLGILWLSQYMARHYLRELANSNQEQKPT